MSFHFYDCQEASPMAFARFTSISFALRAVDHDKKEKVQTKSKFEKN